MLRRFGLFTSLVLSLVVVSTVPAQGETPRVRAVDAAHAPMAAHGQDFPSLPGNVCKTLTDDFDAVKKRNGGSVPDSELGALLNRVAWTHRGESFGLSRKTGGHNVESPVGRIASDILHRQSDNLIWDVIVDAGAPSARVNCGGALGPMGDPNRPWVAPVDAGGPPPPPPPPPGDDEVKKLIGELRASLSENTEMIRRLWEFLGGLDQKLIEVQRQNHELRQELEALKARPIDFPDYTGRVFGAGITLRPQKK